MSYDPSDDGNDEDNRIDCQQHALLCFDTEKLVPCIHTSMETPVAFPKATGKAYNHFQSQLAGFEFVGEVFLYAASNPSTRRAAQLVSDFAWFLSPAFQVPKSGHPYEKVYRVITGITEACGLEASDNGSALLWRDMSSLVTKRFMKVVLDVLVVAKKDCAAPAGASGKKGSDSAAACGGGASSSSAPRAAAAAAAAAGGAGAMGGGAAAAGGSDGKRKSSSAASSSALSGDAAAQIHKMWRAMPPGMRSGDAGASAIFSTAKSVLRDPDLARKVEEFWRTLPSDVRSTEEGGHMLKSCVESLIDDGASGGATFVTPPVKRQRQERPEVTEVLSSSD